MFYKIVSTFLGIGYIGRGSGTVAALIVCIILYLATLFHVLSNDILLIATILLFSIGVVASGKVEKDWGKDSKHVVIDEVIGMTTALLFSPIHLTSLAIGFIFFRFFDIYKPLYIKRTERLPGGWGVMTDDLLAGAYANIALHAVLYFI